MKKIISFSLFGNNKYYLDGAIENAQISEKIFPGWKCRFYIDENVDQNYIKELSNLGSEIIIMKRKSICKFEGITWRFLAASDSDIMICRDVDSLLLERDKIAVDEWLKSDKDFHIIRDYKFPSFRIMGGTWGCRNGILSNMDKLLDNWKPLYQSAQDMIFLSTVVYPIISKNVFIHDEYDNFSDEITHKINYEYNDRYVIGYKK